MAGERLIAIGKLVATHGVRGELRFHPYNPESHALDSVQELFDSARGRALAVVGTRPHRGGWLLTLAGVSTMDDAKRLIGTEVAVRERDLPPLDGGSYYHFQLVGLSVVDESGASLGEVREVVSAGGNDVLVLSSGSEERMVPMVDETVLEVDLRLRRVVVRPPAGLFGP